MDNEFYTLLTDWGMAKIASALADKKQIHLQKMAVGDGGGQYYEPTASQTNLRHEVWRGEMNTLTVAPNNPNWLIAELVLPEDVGGWYVREVGVFDDEGELIAIGKFPESYKPLLPGGCGKQVCIRLIMELSNTTAVTLTVDPSIVLATRDYVDARLDEHEHSTNHPDATLTQKGFTQLSNATDSDDETKAATPKAVKAAMAEARNHTHTWNQITGVPDGTLTQKGIVKLNSATDSTSTTEAATPSAVKAAMDKANAAAPASHTHAWNQITGVPDGTLTQKGIVKLNSATDSTSTTEAATPSAVKAAMDKANAAAPANHTHTQFFTTNGTFTVPDGVTTLFIEVMGGGGGGAGGSQSINYEARGGHAGEQIVSIVNVVPGQQFPVKIGAGGCGGAFWSNPPTTSVGTVTDQTTIYRKSFDGGSSSFSDITAAGGIGGESIYHTRNIQPYIKFVDHPMPYASHEMVVYAELYYGHSGEGSLYGAGGKPGTVITESLANGGYKANMIPPTSATGYGAGGAGGSYLPPFNYQNSDLTNLGNTSGTNGSPGFVKISW
ncbi:TPA: phage tail protein [Salmonella enterica subsp. enterica serovar Paratyphi C]|uniref:phage tail-collar fiber domain-containing protein n=1 Tax=Salmonella enterica TaxID=28901 RepID=UPI001283BE35|nr:phage tail protein [Salmonella enterica]ECI5205080.1 phage tail protein [Salmonella enterica subsp. enterica serovar Paratyphi C]MBW5337805.1 phage tail protein [Salmonella enterica subsp. enterica serovar Paratyphi C]HCC0981187.1 phage tail protein [Salmonella enterica subsp. enterica serovar Paratyphi C]HCC1035629.1 phage tail protein [Salmonella enterica subsp. enterica serovar Paratyphi C]HCC1182559.1 phage tail protein [Salmonella enterica subsp. enterica serovar Paratyphi C]